MAAAHTHLYLPSASRKTSTRKRRDNRVIGRKEGRRKRSKNSARGTDDGWMERANELVQVVRIERGDENEGDKRVYVNYPTVQQYIFMSLRQKCIEII